MKKHIVDRGQRHAFPACVHAHAAILISEAIDSIMSEEMPSHRLQPGKKKIVAS
jgi:hypothetical protein